MADLRAKPARRVLTRNRMGWTSDRLNELSALFVAFCRPGMTVLDVGAAFGVATLAALKSTAAVIANDLDPEHLAELERRAPEEDRGRLRLLPGKFPGEIALEADSLDAVHVSNVVHFLSRADLERGMRAAAGWLRPGGKLFLQAATPWQQPFAAFVPEYERRVQAGVPWPGWIEKVSVWTQHKQRSQMPRSIHLLDERVLRRAMESAGLTVERTWLYRREDLSPDLYFDGRESVAAIARKA